MGATKYKIGEVARMLNTSIRSIRYYEEESLLKPIRTKGGTRLYSVNHVERLKAILRLTHNGFSIESIRVISEAREKCKNGDESSKVMANLLNKTLTNLEKQIQMLNSLKKEIKSAKEIIIDCTGCENIPSSKGCPHCPVRKKLNQIELLNLIWDDDGQP
jgi:DNA-binding transcriptional MerR regulator